MRAARYYDRGDIRIEDIPEPAVGPGQVGIDVAWCGICGTDLHEYADGPIFVPPAGHPHPISHDIFLSSVMVVAPTSSAPRKMNGKHSTLFTWFG